ncbi:MAG TPA: hypothetical protein VF669_20795 [Tepidisphaeraceae bacterium]|jgi:hypothetical protein
MQNNQIQVLLSAYLPMMGGIVLTLISFGVIGKTWKIADPDFEEMWTDSMKVMRFGGPALILIGLCATAYMMLSA